MSRTIVLPTASNLATGPVTLVNPMQMLNLCMGLVPRYMRLREAVAGPAIAEPAPSAPVDEPIMENAEEWVDRMTRDLRRRIMIAG